MLEIQVSGIEKINSFFKEGANVIICFHICSQALLYYGSWFLQSTKGTNGTRGTIGIRVIFSGSNRVDPCLIEYWVLSVIE